MKTDITTKALWIFVGISGAFSVLFGAWLAHGGKALANESILLATYALEYQYYHTLLLLIVLVAHQCKPTKWLLIAMILLFVGLILFCGSLYLKAIFNFTFIGSITPIGGISFALAWLCIIPAGKTFLGKHTL